MARQSSVGWACDWLVSAVFWSWIEKKALISQTVFEKKNEMHVHTPLRSTCNVFRVRGVTVRMPYLPLRKVCWANSICTLTLHCTFYSEGACWVHCAYTSEMTMLFMYNTVWHSLPWRACLGVPVQAEMECLLQAAWLLAELLSPTAKSRTAAGMSAEAFQRSPHRVEGESSAGQQGALGADLLTFCMSTWIYSWSWPSICRSRT